MLSQQEVSNVRRGRVELYPGLSTITASYVQQVDLSPRPPEDLIIAELSCDGPNEIALECKEVILVVDVSGSMRKVLPMVQQTLTSLVGYLWGGSSSPNQSRGLSLCLITFSDEAKLFYPQEGVDLLQAITQMKAEGQTNMGAALEMAYRRVSPNKATWIVVLTDGCSNTGTCQTRHSFEALASSQPPHTKTISLGYGTDFDIGICQSIGRFTYLENEEMIPRVIGAIAGEVLSAWAMDASIRMTCDCSPDFYTYGPVLTGKMMKETLYAGRRFIYTRKAFNLNSPTQVNLDYYDIISQTAQTQTTTVVPGTAPLDFFPAYYNQLARKMIDDIYWASEHNAAYRKDVIVAELGEWNHPQAQEAKETVLRLLQGRERDRFQRASARSVEMASQTSYTDQNMLSPSQRLVIAILGESGAFPNPLRGAAEALHAPGQST